MCNKHTRSSDRKAQATLKSGLRIHRLCCFLHSGCPCQNLIPRRGTHAIEWSSVLEWSQKSHLPPRLTPMFMRPFGNSGNSCDRAVLKTYSKLGLSSSKPMELYSKYTQEIGLRFGILKKAVSPSSIGPLDVTESVHWYESRNSDRPVHV